ncbi:tetratricopeptide repeat protein [Mesonia sp. JHPTF-M18]|uniref:Tetratricopeptide repeat protein n=2 Tax=Mesonia aestuariivivens TaxID=2796128 RepID=A0ABS6W4P8_9FLAO|nr:tetratricopeptide repeat protein [Mesonia aestuariivivens]
MNKGFEYLENGDFNKAEVFFKKILEDYPENKTARVCYGRAVGLNSDANEAVKIFTDLLKIYPEDLEVQLNYAESLLWTKNYKEAKAYYGNLVNENPENFAALLGYANTLSNLKEYEYALDYVNKALEVSPNNPNAMTSKKFMRLGFAYSKTQLQDYENAIQLLNENLNDFPLDRETLLNKANLYLIMQNSEEATDVYLKLATTSKDSIVALNGMALAAHIGKNDKKALVLSKQALLKMKAHRDDDDLVEKTEQRYVQSLIWNRAYEDAQEKIDALIIEYSDKNWILSLRATLGMYTSNFKQSITDYKNILAKDSLSFDGNLGSANAYFADGETKKAYKAIDQTLIVFENQKDALTFKTKIDQKFTPFVEEKVNYTFDNGDNKAYSTQTSIEVPINLKLTLMGDYSYRNTKNSVTKNEATSNSANVGISYQFHPKVKFSVIGGVTSAKSFSNDYTAVLGKAFFNIKPYRLQDLEIGFMRDVQNFNADLLNRNITANNLYLNYNLSTNKRIGWFTQYFYTFQSDENKRNLLFTSLYYNFLSQPVLKGGINYQYISFKNQVPSIYFSPSHFNAVEIFADFLKDENSAQIKSFYYGATAATGFQFIENDKKQSTYRLQGKIGYKFSNRVLLNAYGIHSNIASATAAGFTFTELGLRLKWWFTKQPVFKRN